VDDVDLWVHFPLAYAVTVLIETPVLLLGLSRRHPLRARLFAGVWLTACTYPILWLVLPAFLDPGGQRGLFLAVGEAFAPTAECLLFSLAVGWKETNWRDWAAIVVANLASFGLGELWWALTPG
jgi:hypothetical protein